MSRVAHEAATGPPQVATSRRPPAREAPGRAAAALGLQRAAGNRATSQWVGLVQRSNGNLAVPKGANVTQRRDAQIDLRRRAGAGVDADALVFTRDVDLVAVDLDPGGTMYVPMLAQWSPSGTLEPGGKALAGQFAHKAGDWMQPLDPRYQASYYGVELWSPDASARLAQEGIRFGPRQLPQITGQFAAVPADAVRPLTLGRSDNLEFRPERTPLFPRKPTLADVEQGSLADCGLLAALGTVLHRDPGFPEAIMRDNGATVTVKLFDIVLVGGRKTFQERYVEVDKSTVYFTAAADPSQASQPAFAKGGGGGALWVPILEKAYVAAGFLGTDVATTSFAGYANIEQGSAGTALGHLTGKAAREEEIPPLPPGLMKRGSGIYTAQERELFLTIKRAVDARQNVVVETQEQIVRAGTPTAAGFSGGEQQAKGLVGGHAYTVLDYAPRNPGLVGERTIKVRNPWARYGRGYTKVTDKRGPHTKAQEREAAAEFDLDLRDLAKRFKKVTVA